MQTEVQILRYLAQHPEAKDTAEGIAQWWLLAAEARASIAEIRAALDHLVAQQRLAAERQADGSIYYFRAKAARRADGVHTDSRLEKFSQAAGQRSKQPKQR